MQGRPEDIFCGMPEGLKVELEGMDKYGTG